MKSTVTRTTLVVPKATIKKAGRATAGPQRSSSGWSLQCSWSFQHWSTEKNTTTHAWLPPENFQFFHSKSSGREEEEFDSLPLRSADDDDEDEYLPPYSTEQCCRDKDDGDWGNPAPTSEAGVGPHPTRRTVMEEPSPHLRSGAWTTSHERIRNATPEARVDDLSTGKVRSAIFPYGGFVHSSPWSNYR